MRDKRKFDRLNEKWQVTYHVLQTDRFKEDPISQFTLNISGGGISFMAEEVIEPETMVALELESDQFSSPILALAKVVRCRRKRKVYEIGAEFWWIGWKNDDAQQTIKDYIVSASNS